MQSTERGNHSWNGGPTWNPVSFQFLKLHDWRQLVTILMLFLFEILPMKLVRDTVIQQGVMTTLGQFRLILTSDKYLGWFANTRGDWKQQPETSFNGIYPVLTCSSDSEYVLCI